MILFCDLKGAMQLDCSEDIPAHVSPVTVQCNNASYMEVGALIRHVSMFCCKNECSVFRAINQY
jgi:hypothetical protein